MNKQRKIIDPRKRVFKDMSDYIRENREYTQIKEEMENAYGNLEELEKLQLYLGDYQLLYLKRDENGESQKLIELLLQSKKEAASLPTVGVELEYRSEIQGEIIELLNKCHDFGYHEIPRNYSTSEKSEIRVLPTDPYSFYWLIENIMQHLPNITPSVQICIGDENIERTLPIFLSLYIMNCSYVLPITEGDEETLGFPGVYIGESKSPSKVRSIPSKEHLEQLERDPPRVKISDKDIRIRSLPRRLMYYFIKKSHATNSNPIEEDNQQIHVPKRDIVQTNYLVMYSKDAMSIANTAFYAAKLHALSQEEFQSFRRAFTSFLKLQEKDIQEQENFSKGYGLIVKFPEKRRNEILEKIKKNMGLEDLENKIYSEIKSGNYNPKEVITSVAWIANHVRHLIEEYTITKNADRIYRCSLEEIIS